MEDELFTLLRLGLGNSTLEQESISSLLLLNRQQWDRLHDLTCAQGVLAIVLDGLECLVDNGAAIKTGLATDQKLQWIGEALQMEQANQQQKAVMKDLAEKWSKNGCRVMVMKGQANGTFYPKPEHRSPGDIDCYLLPDNSHADITESTDKSSFRERQAEVYKLGNDIAREAGAEVDESWYKHSVINYKGETFENHQFFVHTRDGKRGKTLEKELEETLEELKDLKIKKLSDFVELPPVQWNAMFLTYHACAHFISEGLRLKQILDWAMFLKAHQDDVNWPLFYAFCERHHLRRFADAMTTIAVKYLGIKVTQIAQITTESPYSEKILHSALYDDDYVFATGSGWHNRCHLIKNLWTYRWKYRDIYRMSPLRQLWYYASGYLFKTE